MLWVTITTVYAGFRPAMSCSIAAVHADGLPQLAEADVGVVSVLAEYGNPAGDPDGAISFVQTVDHTRFRLFSRGLARAGSMPLRVAENLAMRTK
jgi:hypothetical protein